MRVDDLLTNWIARLVECLRACALLIWCCFVGNKVASESETRRIEVGTEDLNTKKKHNKIKTSKYSLLMFLPKNLSEQFRRVVNFYFLMVTVIAIVIDSPVSPATSIAPLSFMVLVTAAKQGYEDWLRHKADNKVNNQIVEIVHKGVIKEVKNSTISPGTLVRVKRGREVPADLVLLCAAGDGGKCFITTANLDGETNLKTLRVPPPLVAYSPDILPQNMKIEVPNPLADLYTFYGKLEIPGLESLLLSPNNLMLRGSRVKNTEWAIGCAVYTGEETKLALNSKYVGNKFSSCEVAVNGFLVFFIFLMLVEIIISVVVKILLEQRHPQKELYIGEINNNPAQFSSIMQDFFSFLLLYYYIIPMSLYVTIEMYKFLGALFIGWDDELRCDETGRPAVANTSDLNEELGQVEVLFSDKTGTLTKNLMVFKTCSIRGKIYEERDSKLYDIERFDTPVDAVQTDIKFFFTILALCHNVQISSEDMKKLSARLSGSGDLQLMNLFRRKKIRAANNTIGANTALEANGVKDTMGSVAWNDILNTSGTKMDYQGSSPDEKALVEAAAQVGVTFLGEEGNKLLLRVGDHTEMYERLQTVEFTSERKRMSIIVRDKEGKIWLFCKGAESSVFPLCKNATMVEETNRDINVFANKGLRTLAVAYRLVPDEEYEKLAQSIKNLDGRSARALEQGTQQYRELEHTLTLCGATGVEDCLQDDVPDTLAALRRAAVRVWLLTGDKVETALNVAQSCAHISENDRRMFLLGVEDETALRAHFQEWKRIVDEPSYRDLTLVVDGASMSMVLDTPHAAFFAEISLKCNAVLCCRLSPIQKAKIVKLIKQSPTRPVTAAIGDGANDISMIQEAHIGLGIFGKEGHQAARSADFAFTKFSMVKKILLVMGHWYYQRLATLIHYFFYKNLILGNIMLAFQVQSVFSTQSIFNSMYLTCFNLVFTSVPCLVLAVTDQCWPKHVLLNNPMLYRKISRNQLMSWSYFSGWFVSAVYHTVVIYLFASLTYGYSIINGEKNLDLWSFGAILFHVLLVTVSAKLWLAARYHTWWFVMSLVLSVLVYMALDTVYALVDLPTDGDSLGTYTRLLASPAFWIMNVVVVVTCLWPDYIARLVSDTRGRRYLQTRPHDLSVSSTRL